MQRGTLLTLGTSLAVTAHRIPSVMAIDKHKDHAGLVFADMEHDGLTRIYRRHRLLIVAQRDDNTAGGLSESVVDVLARGRRRNPPPLRSTGCDCLRFLCKHHNCVDVVEGQHVVSPRGHAVDECS